MVGRYKQMQNFFFPLSSPQEDVFDNISLSIVPIGQVKVLHLTLPR
jgi:hypothetical protein